jgi:hypothetical protein
VDGFGARGWKLNSTLDDPEIIASTRETGKRCSLALATPGTTIEFSSAL